jgi:hypothetical protein
MWEAEIGRITVPGQLRQKFLRDPHLNIKKCGMVLSTYHPNNGGKLKIGRS